MSEVEQGPAGLMVLHLWVESGDRMRVRITQTAGRSTGQPSTSYASTKAAVLEAVEGWLDSVTPR